MPTLKRARAKPYPTPSRSVVEKALLSAGGSAGNSRARKPLDIAFRRVTQGPMALGWQDLPYAVRPGQEPPLQILREVYGPSGKRSNVKQAKAKGRKAKK
jgi:hypothetical protein